jgi:hypothetical protein
VPLSASEIRNPVLLAHVVSNLQRDEVDYRNSSHWRQVRVNGGAWQDLPLVKNVNSNVDRGWSTARLPLTNVVPGTNRIDFRYPIRPSNATWHSNGYRVKDVEIQIAGTGTGGTPPTNTPQATPTRTPTPTAVPTGQPTATRTPTSQPTPGTTPTVGPASKVVNFDTASGQNQPLNGQYPTGVINWGTGKWYLSAPYGRFNTKSVSFNGAALTSAKFTFVSAKRLIAIDAYNGGGSNATVKVSCAGKPTRTVTITPDKVTTINLNWSGTCSEVTITSSNGWETNFDNIRYQ